MVLQRFYAKRHLFEENSRIFDNQFVCSLFSSHKLLTLLTSDEQVRGFKNSFGLFWKNACSRLFFFTFLANFPRPQNSKERKTDPQSHQATTKSTNVVTKIL